MLDIELRTPTELEIKFRQNVRTQQIVVPFLKMKLKRTCRSVNFIVWWASPFIREERSGVMSVCHLFWWLCNNVHVINHEYH